MSLFDSASVVITPSGYKEDKLYSIKPTDGSGDLVVTRATTATRVNSAGLIEQVPYNLLTYSQEFDNAAWNKLLDGQVTITANSTIAPDGTNTADKIIPSAISGFHCVQQQITLSNTTASVSIYAKASENSFLQIFDALTTDYVNFNLTTGTVGSSDEYVGNIENVGNGWYRCIATKAFPSGNLNVRFSVVTSSTATRGESFTGNGTSGLFIWGAQLVTGTSAKEYFPTTDRLNVPRLDYTNSSCPSILIEPQRTNLLTYSEDFSSTRGWSSSNAGGSTTTFTANYGIAPDGTNSADRIQLALNGGPYADWLTFANPMTTGQTYTYSIYIKSLTSNCSLYILGLPSYGNILKNVTTEWVRYDFTFVATSGAIYPRFLLESISSTSADILVWGMQLEQGSYATSYIPTIASSVTRNADVISKTGISSLIGQTEGTIFFDGFVNGSQNPSTNLVNSEKNTITSFTMQYIKGTKKIFVSIFDNNIQKGNITSSEVIEIGQRVKIAYAYKSGNFALYINGNLSGTNTDTYTFPSTLDDIFIGDVTTYFAYQESISNNTTALWKTRLTNTELAQLTTI